ncbi:MAG: hypothetical protein ABJ205_05770 [Erythrobacter sp.]|uniref:hypothetical protein n=1 Tax=Erythrobacter sp. TaxID=1042 RepID=UPI003265D0C5
MESLVAAISALNPVLALIGGIVIGVCITLGFKHWSLKPRRNADPLSSLFARGTLDSQLSQIADPDALSERKDRAASAFRAKMFARRAAHTSDKADVPPHHAERFDHAAVLAHVAKVMRAGTELDTNEVDASTEQEIAESSPWEEVLMLPPPSHSAGKDGVAKAA